MGENSLDVIVNHERRILAEKSWENSWEGNHGMGTIGRENWERNRGIEKWERRLMGEDSWKSNHVNGMM